MRVVVVNNAVLLLLLGVGFEFSFLCRFHEFLKTIRMFHVTDKCYLLCKISPGCIVFPSEQPCGIKM